MFKVTLLHLLVAQCVLIVNKYRIQRYATKLECVRQTKNENVSSIKFSLKCLEILQAEIFIYKSTLNHIAEMKYE